MPWLGICEGGYDGIWERVGGCVVKVKFVSSYTGAFGGESCSDFLDSYSTTGDILDSWINGDYG